MRFWSAMNSLIAMRILKRDADLGTQCGLGMRCGFWNATRVLERDAARHVATNALPPAESREHTPWGQSLAQGDQTVVRQVLDGVGAVLVAELVGNCIGHVGMVLVGYYGRLIVRPDLGCRQEESLDSTPRR